MNLKELVCELGSNLLTCLAGERKRTLTPSLCYYFSPHPKETGAIWNIEMPCLDILEMKLLISFMYVFKVLFLCKLSTV